MSISKNQKRKMKTLLARSMINLPRSLPLKKVDAPFYTFTDFYTIDKESKKLNNSIKLNPYKDSIVIDASDTINHTLLMMLQSKWVCDVGQVSITSIDSKRQDYAPPRYFTLLKNLNITRFNFVIQDMSDRDHVTLVDVKRLHAMSEEYSSIVFFKVRSKPLIFPGTFLEDSTFIVVFHNSEIYFFNFNAPSSSTERYRYIESMTGISSKSYCHYVNFYSSHQRLFLQFDVGKKTIYLDMLY